MYANKKRTHATIMYAVCKLLSYNMYHYCGFTASSFPLPQHYRNSKPITAVKPQLSSPLPQDLPWFYHGEIPSVTLSAVNNNGKKYWQYQYLLIKVLAIPVPTLFLKSIAIPILYQNRNCRPQLSSPLPQDLPRFYRGEIPHITLSAVNNNGKKYWQYQYRYLLIKVLAIPVPTLFLKSIAIPILYQLILFDK